MALKSEQARVLRRRVLGGLIRNLLLFSGAFALACLAIETFMVPSIANWVADSTSSWRTLNSSEQFQQILTDQGLLDDANLFETSGSTRPSRAATPTMRALSPRSKAK